MKKRSPHLRQPTFDPKQFRHSTPLQIVTERFLAKEQYRLTNLGRRHGLSGAALRAWVKLDELERKRVLEAHQRINLSLAPQATITFSQQTMTGRFSSRSPNVANIPRSTVVSLASPAEAREMLEQYRMTYKQLTEFHAKMRRALGL
jgi:hypothetical protein